MLMAQRLINYGPANNASMKRRDKELFPLHHKQLSLSSSWESAFKSEKRKNLMRDGSVQRKVSLKLRLDVVVQPNLLGSLMVSRNSWDETQILPKIQQSVNLRNEDNKDAFKVLISPLSDSQFLQLFREVVSHCNLHNHLILVRAMEDDSSRRLVDISADAMLLIADSFFMMNYRPNHYMKALMHRVYMRWEELNLNPQQTMQLLFYISVYRNMTVELKNLLEGYILLSIDKLTINEIGLVCHAFFASNSRIENYILINAISNHLLNNMNELTSFNLANILKTLKHAGFESKDFYDKLGNNLIKIDLLKSAYLSTIVHVANAFGSAKIVHEKLFSFITDQMEKNCNPNKNIRTKDIVRIIWTFSNMQFPISERIKDLLVTELRKSPEIRTQFSESFVEGLMSLAIADCYPWDLISHALSENFLQMKISKSNGKSNCFLASVKILMDAYCRHQAGPSVCPPLLAL